VFVSPGMGEDPKEGRLGGPHILFGLIQIIKLTEKNTFTKHYSLLVVIIVVITIVVKLIAALSVTLFAVLRRAH
jgi:FtsH-binding integral membrane protein